MSTKKITKINNMQDLYDLAGSATQIAADLKIHQYTVERWKISGIPLKYWDSLADHYGATPVELYKLSQKIRSFRKAA